MNKIIQKLNADCKPGDLIIYDSSYWFHIGEIHQYLFVDLRVSDDEFRLFHTSPDDIEENVLSII